MLILCLVARVRGICIGKNWLVIFPALAIVFDFVPGLNSIPLIPTIMHLLAITMGVFGVAVVTPDAIASNDNESSLNGNFAVIASTESSMNKSDGIITALVIFALVAAIGWSQIGSQSTKAKLITVTESTLKQVAPETSQSSLDLEHKKQQDTFIKTLAGSWGGEYAYKGTKTNFTMMITTDDEITFEGNAIEQVKVKNNTETLRSKLNGKLDGVNVSFTKEFSFNNKPTLSAMPALLIC